MLCDWYLKAVKEYNVGACAATQLSIVVVDVPHDPLGVVGHGPHKAVSEYAHAHHQGHPAQVAHRRHEEVLLVPDEIPEARAAHRHLNSTD